MTGATTAVAALASPWKGLAPYDDSDLDEQLFFGREREVEVACANLTAARLTVLFGATGVGKSSLLRAGVMRRLRDTDAGESAAAIVSSWTGDPVAAIETAMRTSVEAAIGRSVEEPAGSLADRFRAWADDLGGPLYLVLDQMEELFLYHGDEEGPGSFVGEFPPLVTDRGLSVHVLIGIREDSLGRLDTLRAAIPGVLSNYLRLERLDRDAARTAITGPLTQWNTFFPDRGDDHGTGARRSGTRRGRRRPDRARSRGDRRRDAVCPSRAHRSAVPAARARAAVGCRTRRGVVGAPARDASSARRRRARSSSSTWTAHWQRSTRRAATRRPLSSSTSSPRPGRRSPTRSGISRAMPGWTLPERPSSWPSSNELDPAPGRRRARRDLPRRARCRR